MKPSAKVTPREVVDASWWLTTDADGKLTHEGLQSATLLDLANTLRRLDRKLDALGEDGIHELIRRAVKDQRRKDRARLEAARRARAKKAEAGR